MGLLTIISKGVRVWPWFISVLKPSFAGFPEEVSMDILNGTSHHCKQGGESVAIAGDAALGQVQLLHVQGRQGQEGVGVEVGAASQIQQVQVLRPVQQPEPDTQDWV